MIPLTLTEVADVVGGALADAAGDALLTGPASIDSRAVPAGGLFVAIAGERVDGHDYATAAVAAGAVAVLGARPTGVATVVVDDPVDALGRLARHVRDRLRDCRVLALTGSQGKTGTKDYLATVLARTGSDVVATLGNLNNELGVPLTVLRADERTRYLVVEMGARGVGHIRRLCEIARPDVAAVLNVGSAHLGEFGTVEAIARAKGEILEELAVDGVAVIAADDPRVAPMRGRTRARVVTFGGPGADVVGDPGGVDPAGRLSFTLGGADRSAAVRLALPGRHQVANATAAAAMALAVGLDLDDVADGLRAARSASRWRMEVAERPDGVTVVNDAYNANPASMAAALESLTDMTTDGRRAVAVLGEMRELGDTAYDAHHAVGARAAALGIDVLVVVDGAPGGAAAAIADGAGTRGGPTVVRTAGRDEATAWVGHNVSSGDVVLVKASRGLALEHLVDALLGLGATPAIDSARTEGERG